MQTAEPKGTAFAAEASAIFAAESGCQTLVNVGSGQKNGIALGFDVDLGL